MVLSELRKSNASSQVVSWFERQNEDGLFISAISLGEISRGIAKAERRDPLLAQLLEIWLAEIERGYGEHIVPFGAAAARIWGRLSYKLGHQSADLQIAATAIAKDLTVATRNIRHFEPTGAQLINPWQDAKR